MNSFSKQILILLLSLNSCSLYSQFDKDCSAECLIRAKYVPGYQRLPKYTGKNRDTLTNKDIYVLKFNPTPKQDRYYLTFDPSCRDTTIDCWIAQRVNIAAVQEIEYFVKDTLNKSVKFKWALFPSDKEILQQAHKEPRYIICPDRVTENIIQSIEAKLKELEYYDSDITGKMNEILISAMNSYQIDNDLAISEQDFITIELYTHLGIYKPIKTVKRRYK